MHEEILASKVERLGITTLLKREGRYFITLKNRTYFREVELLTPEQVARWRDYIIRRTQLANMNRVAYFIPSKKEGLFVGPVPSENLDTLISVIKEAKAQDKEIVFFLWKNQPDERRKSVATLTVAVSQPREGGSTRRPIGNAPTKTAPANDPLAGLMGGGAAKKKESDGW